MNIYIPYTYLIGWSNHNKFYYGVRYAKNCNPSDLWKTYFTSSKHVKEFYEKNGDPDIVQIRKTFLNQKSARIWENKVLKRLKVIEHNHFLNKSNNKSICPILAQEGAKKKRNRIKPPHNKTYFHCIGCRKQDKPFAIMSGHVKCRETFYGIPPIKNHMCFDSSYGKKMAKQNNSQSTCPHCNSIGQYRAMKRWHFDNCRYK